MSTVLARLATVAGLTAPGQVSWGWVDQPPTVPFACAWLEGVEGAHGPDLTSYRRNITIAGLVWVASTADTAQSREAAAADMLDLVLAALEGSDATLGGLAWDVAISATSFDGASTPWADRGLVAWELRASYAMAHGSGA
jgi:hypothetical protein